MRLLPRPTRTPSAPRRRGARVLVGLTAATALLLAGCGSGADEPAPAAAAEAPGDAGAFPVTIEHSFGETTIPAKPTRVVTIGFNEQDFTLALGVVPVGTREYFGYDYAQRPWAQEALGGATLPTVGGEELDVEAVAALRPDLILGVYSFIDADQYASLAQIAPTVAQSGDYPVGGVPWQEQTLVTGKALGLEPEATRVVADVAAEFDAAKAANPGFAGSSLVVDYLLGGIHTPLDATDLRFRFFGDLGFTTPSTGGAFESGLSGEQLGLLDQDVLVVAGETREQALGTPLFAQLPVVTEGRTVFLGPFDGDVPAALGFGSPLSLSFALDAIVPQLAAAASGSAG